MADPLSTLVDREAPAPTDYFNPAASSDIMSRYASARRGVASSEVLARSSERLAQGRVQARNMANDDIENARRRVLDTREDEDYQAKKDAEKSATEVLKTIDTAFDANDPDSYDQQLAEFVKGVPASVMDDPRVKTLLQVKTAIADDNRTKAAAAERYKASRENTLAILGYKDLMGATRAGVTPDVLDATINPDTGEPDFAKINHLRGEIERKNEMEKFTKMRERIETGQIRLAEKKNLSKRGQERRTKVEKSLVTNTRAFPKKVDLLLAKSGKKKASDLEFGEYAEEYRKAVEWDKDQINHELSAAKTYSNRDKFVNMEGMELNEEEKARRGELWDVAHEPDTFEERGEDAPAQEAPAEEKFKVGKPYKDAKGNTRVYKGGGKWE